MELKEKLSGGAFKHVESELYAYHHTKKELIQRRKVYSSDDSRIQYLDRIVKTISSVYRDLPIEKKRFVKLLYWKHPQPYTWDGIASKCDISKKEAQVWRKAIVNEIGEKLGWK